MLYTVILDFRGGTYISQVRASSISTAMLKWADKLKEDKEHPLNSSTRASFARQLDLKPEWNILVPIDGCKHTWCGGCLVGDDYGTFHVVATAE